MLKKTLILLTFFKLCKNLKNCKDAAYDLNENKSIGFYEIARIKFDSDIKDALKNVLKALELKKNFAPYVKLHLEIIINLKDNKK